MYGKSTFCHYLYATESTSSLGEGGGGGHLCMIWASYEMSKIAGAHAPKGMPGTFSLPPRVSDSDMHAGIAN